MLGLSPQNRNGVLLIAAAVLAAAGWMVKLDKDRDLAAASDRDRPTRTTLADDAPSTSTTVGLIARSYETGDCVTWEAGGRRQRTEIVDCDEPYRIQITAEVDVPGTADEYPTEAEWGQIAVEHCDPAAQAYLGYPLDPQGRFHAGMIQPQEEGWRRGDHEVWCGIMTRGDDESRPPASHEDMRGANQQYRFQPGDCVDYGPPEYAPMVVACDKQHREQVLGDLDLSDLSAPPSDAEVGDLALRCVAQAEAQLGRRPSAPWDVRVQSMEPGTWASGGRAVRCFVGQFGPDGMPLPVSEPAPRG